PEATSDHFQKLSIGKIKALSAVMIVSGEEEVKKLWNEESVYVFGRLYYRDDNVDYNSLLSFAKELSPDLKKHLPTEFSSSSGQTDEKLGRTIWYNEGLHGKVLHLRELQSMVLSVPSDLRESFFVALEPVKRVFWSEGKFIRESVSNYIDYSERCTGSTGITYGDFINNLDFFSSERYPAVKKGFEVYKEAGLEAKVKNYFSLFELAGGLEGEAGNALALKFISQSDSCVKKRVNYGNISFIVEKRNASDTECLYKFSAFCQRAFVKDTDLLLQFLNFDEADVQIITSFLNNSLVANNEQLADIQVVEGEIIKLVREYKQLEEGADNPRAREYHRFTKLSREQKLDYTALSKKVKNASYQEVCRALFVAVESGSAKKILDFVALQNPNWLVDLEMTAKMAERPDCLGLFHYLGNRSGQDSLAAIDKLIALHDAGITDSITLSELINEKGDTEGQFIEEILKWDVAKLVKVTNEIEVLFPDLYRGRFSFFWFVCRENSTKDVEQIIRDVRHCVAYGQYYSFHHEVSEEEIGLEELRLQEAERVLGGEVENSKRHNLQWCSKDVWERLRTNRDWLVKCLEKNSFPYVIATVSDDMLNNKLFWGIELPDHKYPNELLITEEVIRKLFAVIEHLHSAGMEISQFQGHYGRQYWVAVVDAFEISPWLFSIDNLNFLKTTIPLHEVINIKDITPLEFVLLKQHSEFITFGHHNFLWWLRGLRAGKLLSLDELRTLNRSFSVKIPFEVFQMTEGRTGPNETVMDAILRLGREADGRIMAEIEGQHKKDILTLIGNIAPKLAGWLDSSYYSASFLQKISEIPPAYLTNLEIIFSGDNFSYFRSDESFFDTFVLIASHPGMGNVKRLMDLKLLGVYNLENVAPSKLATFLDRLTSQLIDDYQNICSYIDMSPLDTTDFFENQKLADLVIMFADQLQAIFDEGSISKKLSVYDLLVMDFESDLRNLKILQTNCFGKLSADTLQALSLVVEGEMLVTVQKVLAFFNGRQKIEYNSVKAQLDKMPPTLRVDVILNKGARNFGWEVLKYQE
ncbi:MAG: hypothetical protein Q7S24_01885, partial [bacterium]|nr:hypothetical protein [bacterium]